MSRLKALLSQQCLLCDLLIYFVFPGQYVIRRIMQTMRAGFDNGNPAFCQKQIQRRLPGPYPGLCINLRILYLLALPPG